MTRLLARYALSAAFMFSAACAAAAQTSFYAGKTIKLSVGGSPGGGYDSQARLLATHMPKFIEGQPSIIVQNMPGAGGIGAANYLGEIAKKDGTEIGLVQRAALFAAFAKNDRIRFNPETFNWIGSTASYDDTAFVVFIRGALPYRTLDDMKTAPEPVVFGNKGAIFVPLVKGALGANIRIIDSYQNTDINLAIERGEIDGTGTGYQNIQRQFPQWLKDGSIRFLVQFGHEKRISALPDVPTARELITNPEDMAVVKFSELSLTLGYPFAAPAGAPVAQVDMLRRAFEATMRHPEYQAAVERAGLDFSPVDGAKVAQYVSEGARTPAPIIERFNALSNSVE